MSCERHTDGLDSADIVNTRCKYELGELGCRDTWSFPGYDVYLQALPPRTLDYLRSSGDHCDQNGLYYNWLEQQDINMIEDAVLNYSQSYNYSTCFKQILHQLKKFLLKNYTAYKLHNSVH